MRSTRVGLRPGRMCGDRQRRLGLGLGLGLKLGLGLGAASSAHRLDREHLPRARREHARPPAVLGLGLKLGLGLGLARASICSVGTHEVPVRAHVYCMLGAGGTGGR